MIQAINPFLNFNGTASDAISLYEKALGAKVEDRMPWTDDTGKPDPTKVMYARLVIDGASIELSDVPPGMKVPPAGSSHVMLHFGSPKDLDKTFAALSEGAEIRMPVENMFWGARYGSLVDKFGVQWAFHCQLETPSK